MAGGPKPMRPSVGWALGDGREHDDDPAHDAVEAAQLYDLLEEQVIPEFYSRDAGNIPRAWVARVRESMASLTPIYSANRSVREYVERAYVPAAASTAGGRENGARGGRGNQRLATHARARLAQGCDSATKIDTRGDRHHFTVEIDLGALSRTMVCVELYADEHRMTDRCFVSR